VSRRRLNIEVIRDAPAKHEWVCSLFWYGYFVRFPLYTWDADPGDSLSWISMHPHLCAQDWEKQLRRLPRWSTASRSCLAMIPADVDTLATIKTEDAVNQPPRFGPRDQSDAYVNVLEWADNEKDRFWKVVGDPGQAASRDGTILLRQVRQANMSRYRLYSVKTGVNYVGSHFEGEKAGKQRLEANCSMAMLRSQVIDSMPNNDYTLGVQTEVLAITAPITIVDDTTKERRKARRDGFQVRDLSCMQRGLDYSPGQAIPYARANFDNLGTCDPKKPTIIGNLQLQCDFWRRNFAVPLGRAKARLFLNYGLMHTSANAQNFLVGFNGYVPKQLVPARTAFTSLWHDENASGPRVAEVPQVIAAEGFEQLDGYLLPNACRRVRCLFETL